MVESEGLERAKIYVCRFVAEDNLDRLGKLLQNGFPPDTPLNKIGQTPLMIFAQTLNKDGMLLLL